MGPEAPPPQPGAPVHNQGTNGFAIAALVLGLLACFPLGIVFGILALRRIKRTGESGRGLAIAGIVLSAVWVVVGAGILVYVVSTDVERGPNGEITSAGRLSLFDLRVGDCIENIDEDNEAFDVTGVPCSDEHEGEVYAIVDIDGADYPGDAEVSETADTRCDERLREEAPGRYDELVEGLFYYTPTEESWDLNDDRSVACLIRFDPPRTGRALR